MNPDTTVTPAKLTEHGVGCLTALFSNPQLPVNIYQGRDSILSEASGVLTALRTVLKEITCIVLVLVVTLHLRRQLASINYGH